MKNYSYTYVYHNYNTFLKDGKPITYGQVVLSKRDGTPFIEKITCKDFDKWAEVRTLLPEKIQVEVCYNKYGKLEFSGHHVIDPGSPSAFDEEGLPF